MRPLLPAVALGASLLVLASSAEQSLGDVSRATEAARNATAGRPAAKVYTNKDLPIVDLPLLPATNATAPAPANASAPAAAPSTPPAGTLPSLVKDEAYLADRMRPLRERLDAARALADDTKRRADALMRAADRCFQIGIVCADYSESLRLTEEHKALVADVARAERDVVALEEEARRAGVPPGWVRDDRRAAGLVPPCWCSRCPPRQRRSRRNSADGPTTEPLHVLRRQRSGSHRRHDIHEPFLHRSRSLCDRERPGTGRSDCRECLQDRLAYWAAVVVALRPREGGLRGQELTADRQRLAGLGDHQPPPAGRQLANDRRVPRREPGDVVTSGATPSHPRTFSGTIFDSRNASWGTIVLTVASSSPRTPPGRRRQSRRDRRPRRRP